MKRYQIVCDVEVGQLGGYIMHPCRTGGVDGRDSGGISLLRRRD
ncbi:MAG: hypothetical protein ABIP78_03055 [Pyrinomonadaceae bacterium]